MTTRRTLYQRLFDSTAAIRVRDIKAARAVYESEDIQRVEVILTDEAGNRLTLELTSKQTRDLITNLSTCYNAIHPSLPGNGYGQHWGMQ